MRSGLVFAVLSCAVIAGCDRSSHGRSAESSPSPPTTPQVRDKDYIPMDLPDAIAYLDETLAAEDKQKLRSGELVRADLHMGWGMGLRNDWGLWQESRLAKYFNGLGIFHPDDMSGIIIESYVRHLRGQPIELEKQVAEYRN